jgi:hypothetical protein
MVPACIAADCPAHKFIKKFFTYRFVMGVRAEFDSIRTRLLYDSSTLTMTKALSDLFAEETRLWSLTSSMHVSHSVLASSQKFSTPKSASLEPCPHCGKTGHTPNNCFLHHPEKLAEFRARRAGRTTRGRAIVSTPRGSVSAAVAAGSSSSSWVLDSRASFHVTSDQSQLAAYKPVADGASIKTADGTSCHITHQGSLSNSYLSVPDVSFVP